MADRKHVVEMPPGDISNDGESVDFNFVDANGNESKFRASTDAIDVIMFNLEQLAILALRKRMDLGTDRGVAPKELPALRTICDGFVVEEAEPEDNFEGYRLLAYRLSRPPIMLLLRREGFDAFVEALCDSQLAKTPREVH